MPNDPTNIPPTKEFIRNSLQYGLLSDGDLDNNSWAGRFTGSLNSEAAYLVGRNRGRVARIFIKFSYDNKERIKSIPILRNIALYTKDKLMKHRNITANRSALDFSPLLGLGVDEFIQNLYLHALGRTPDEQGFDNAKRALRSGLPKEGLIYLVCTSTEFANKAPVTHLGAYRKIYSRYILHERIRRLPIIGLPFQIRAIERQVANLISAMEVVNQNITNANSKIDVANQNISNANSKIDVANQNIINANVKIDNTAVLIKNQIVYGIPGGITVIHTEKFIFGVPSEEWRLASYLGNGGVLEPGTEEYFCSLAKRDMNIVDVGANIGVYTLHALAAGCNVYSYEPTPKVYKILKDNIGINGFEPTGRAHTYNVAVSDVDGEVEFNIFDTSGHNSMFSEGESYDVIHVKTVCLDNHLSDLKRVHIVKIDVEGAEALVLQGMKNIIAMNPDIKIIMEFAPSNLKRAGTEPEGLISMIRAMGLGIAVIDEDSRQIRTHVTDEELCKVYSVNVLLQRLNIKDVITDSLK